MLPTSINQVLRAELYHSTPETQTDESYTHPEDIEHFAIHDQIERAEAEREAEFQGITVEEALHQHDAPPKEPEGGSARPKLTRITPPEKQDPLVKFGSAAEDAKARSEWGSGEEGFKPPKTPAERLRYEITVSSLHKMILILLTRIGKTSLTR
jgi:nucleobindin